MLTSLSENLARWLILPDLPPEIAERIWMYPGIHLSTINANKEKIVFGAPELHTFSEVFSITYKIRNKPPLQNVQLLEFFV